MMWEKINKPRSQWLAALLIVGFGLLFQSTAWAAALAPPHNASNNIDCADCHGGHEMYSVVVRRGEEQDALCKSCHKPLRQAPEMHEVELNIVVG